MRPSCRLFRYALSSAVRPAECFECKAAIARRLACLRTPAASCSTEGQPSTASVTAVPWAGSIRVEFTFCTHLSISRKFSAMCLKHRQWFLVLTLDFWRVSVNSPARNMAQLPRLRQFSCDSRRRLEAGAARVVVAYAAREAAVAMVALIRFIAGT